MSYFLLYYTFFFLHFNFIPSIFKNYYHSFQFYIYYGIQYITLDIILVHISQFQFHIVLFYYILYSIEYWYILFSYILDINI